MEQFNADDRRRKLTAEAESGAAAEFALRRRRSALESAGWVFADPAVPCTASKDVGGFAPVRQAGETPDELIARAESWEASQAALKPQFRLGNEDVIRAAGRSDWGDSDEAA